VEVLETLEFVHIQNLRNMLSDLDRIQFALQTQRTQGLQIAASLQKITGFFSNIVRFPEAGPEGRFVVVQVSGADWPFKFAQLISSLQYKTPDINATNKDLSDSSANWQIQKSAGPKMPGGPSGNDDATKCVMPVSEREKFEKAMFSFVTSIADMRSQITSSTLTRRLFEAKFNLSWT